MMEGRSTIKAYPQNLTVSTIADLHEKQLPAPTNWVSFYKADTGVADTEFDFDWPYDYVPKMFITLYINKGGVVYDSGTAWTTSKIYFKCSTANTKILVMVA